jgi:hypothetical protein
LKTVLIFTVITLAVFVGLILWLSPWGSVQRNPPENHVKPCCTWDINDPKCQPPLDDCSKCEVCVMNGCTGHVKERFSGPDEIPELVGCCPVGFHADLNSRRGNPFCTRDGT